MPGMMDTILNLGLNDQVVVGLGVKSGERFAYDSYRRFIDMFGNVVSGSCTSCSYIGVSQLSDFLNEYASFPLNSSVTLGHGKTKKKKLPLCNPFIVIGYEEKHIIYIRDIKVNLWPCLTF